MNDKGKMPELKQILGAMIFGAKRPLGIKEMRGCILDVAQTQGGFFAHFAAVKPADIAEALHALAADLEKSRCGMHLQETSTGFRIETDHECGPWLRHLLDIGAPNRLSRPALETLAIIAYRQPVSKIEIERIRGVSADHIIRALLEMQLVRIAGRSELPGRPFLYGTTQAFLDHFGLKDLTGLHDYDTLRAKEESRKEAEKAASQAAAAKAAAAPAATPEGELELGAPPPAEGGEP